MSDMGGAGDLLRRPPVSCAPETPAAEVARRLSREAVGSVVVTDADGRGIGIVTDRDLRDLVASGGSPDSTPAAALMSSPVPLTAYSAAGGTTNNDHIDAALYPDPLIGAPTAGSVKDGLSNSLAFYEDVGRNETWAASRYLDPTINAPRASWRWAEPDNASGVSKGINANKHPFGGPSTCPWTNHDCGPNNEVFSFHIGGANALFMDGHVLFLREEISPVALRALATRNGGAGEAAYYGEAGLK